MSGRRIKWVISRTIYIVQTVFWASFAVVAGWAVVDDKHWGVRCMFGIGAAVSAWVATRHVQWLFSEAARRDAVPIPPGYPRPHDRS